MLSGRSSSLLVNWNKVGDDWHVVSMKPSHSQMSIQENYSEAVLMRQWCRANCKGKYSVSSTSGPAEPVGGGGRFAFEDEKDAFRFKLKYGEKLK